MLARFVVFVLLLTAVLAQSFAATLSVLWPGAFGGAGRAWRRQGAGLAMALGVMAAEYLARRLAPVGGGLWRPLLTVLRDATVVAVGVAMSVWGARVITLPMLGRRKSSEAAVDAAPEAAVIERREALVRGASVAGAAVAGAAVLRGGLVERHALGVTEVEVVIPGLPTALEGLTVVQLTDLHIGVFTGQREMDHVAEVVASLRPDLVVLTGDVLDNQPRHIPDAMRSLARVRGRRGTFAALGNHDHYAGPERVARALAAAGIHPLVNASVLLGAEASGRGGLVLAGVDDVMAPRIGSGTGPDLARALRDRDPEAPVVLLAHNPEYFREAAGRVSLQLSGHTHGGQVFLGPVTRSLLPYVAGRFEERSSTLYVSRGVGITGPPVRLWAPPEVVRFALTSRRRA